MKVLVTESQFVTLFENISPSGEASKNICDYMCSTADHRSV
jgi:hypothetical protein